MIKDALFASMFDVPRPYGGYQIEPAEHLLNGRNVILRAPTGSGKTKAALFPYFRGRKEALDFPRKLLYCVPMRVVARDLYEDLKKGDRQKVDTRIQTGEQQDDRRLEGEVVFTTIDQALSSFLNIPYSLSLRQGNVNAGAIASSYLVFDEFHLFDPGSTLPTTLEMLRMLKGISPFLLMTATFSDKMLKRLSALLDTEIVTVSAKEARAIPTQRAKERYIHRADGFLTANTVLAHHHTRSIVICNTVERAQNLFQELSLAVKAQSARNTEVGLLHSRFLQADRRCKEDYVRHFFGKDREKSGSIILVATQVVEVGLDITCEVMHTEVAPASSILQRAGRCARFEGEKGEVYVYQVPLDQRGEPNYAPYLGDQQSVLCQKTWDALPSFEGENMNLRAEQRLIDRVHCETDRRMLDGLEQASYLHRKKIESAIERQEIGRSRELIRNDDSATLLVHANPWEIERPYDLEGFSLFFGTLKDQFKEWQEAGLPDGTTPWVIKYPDEDKSVEVDDRPVRYEWKEVKVPDNLNRSTLYVINPLLARYDNECGFRFERGGAFQSPLSNRATRAKRERQAYRLESYQKHIQKMLETYQTRLSSEIPYPTTRLEHQMGLESGALDWAIHLAIAFHDAGKMQRSWQDWAHRWQREVGAPVTDDFMVAHTDYNPKNPKHQAIEEKRTLGSRPFHAVEGAVAVHKVVHQLLGAPKERNDPRFKLMKAVFTAIARHHSPKAESYHDFDLCPVARSALAYVLPDLGDSRDVIELLEISKKSQPVTGLLVKPNSRDELLAYFLIVRALRLADQRATGGKD